MYVKASIFSGNYRVYYRERITLWRERLQFEQSRVQFDLILFSKLVKWKPFDEAT